MYIYCTKSVDRWIFILYRNANYQEVEDIAPFRFVDSLIKQTTEEAVRGIYLFATEMKTHSWTIVRRGAKSYGTRGTCYSESSTLVELLFYIRPFVPYEKKSNSTLEFIVCRGRRIYYFDGMKIVTWFVCHQWTIYFVRNFSFSRNHHVIINLLVQSYIIC